MAKEYEDLIREGINLGKSQEEISKQLIKTGLASKTSFSYLDTVAAHVWKPEEEAEVVELSASDKTRVDKEQQAVTDTDTLIEDIKNYKGLIDEGGFAAKWDERAGKLKTARGRIVVGIKTAENLGTLDQGLLDFAETLVGVEPIKEWNRIDSREAKKVSSSLTELLRQTEADKAKLVGVPEEDMEAKEAQQGQVDAKLNMLHEYSQNNPDDPRSIAFMKEWDADNIDLTTGKVKNQEAQTPVEKRRAELAQKDLDAAQEFMPTAEEPGRMEQFVDEAKGIVTGEDKPLSEFGTDVIQAGKDLWEGAKEVHEMEVNSPSDFAQKKLHEAGVGAELVTDVAGALFDISTSFPPVALAKAGATAAAGATLDQLLDTEEAQDAINQWGELEKTNPEAAMAIKDAGQVAGALSVFAGGTAGKAALTKVTKKTAKVKTAKITREVAEETKAIEKVAKSESLIAKDFNKIVEYYNTLKAMPKSEARTKLLNEAYTQAKKHKGWIAGSLAIPTTAGVTSAVMK